MPTISSASSVVMVVAVVAGAGTGAAIDLMTRRIPNVVTASTAAAGIGLAAVGVTQISIASSVLGFALGLLLMLPGHALGATGAGDVKLLAAVGAILGVERILAAFLYTAIVGGGLAIAFALGRGRLAVTLRRTLRVLHTPAVAKREIESPAANNRFAYGPAIAVGSVLAILLRG